MEYNIFLDTKSQLHFCINKDDIQEISTYDHNLIDWTKQFLTINTYHL